MTTIEQDTLNAELLATYEAWSKHPVTKKIVEHVKTKCNEAASRSISSALSPSTSDAAVRQTIYQLSAFNDVHTLLTSANAFVGIIPTIKKP